MYMKRVSANICYTHSTEENKILISFDFYDTNISLICESNSTAIRDDDIVRNTFDLTKILSCSYMYNVPPLWSHIL